MFQFWSVRTCYLSFCSVTSNYVLSLLRYTDLVYSDRLFEYLKYMQRRQMLKQKTTKIGFIITSNF